jgi:hypothetical protein
VKGEPDESGPLELDLYGLRVSVQSDWGDVIAALRRDFGWFERADAQSSPVVRVQIERKAPDYDALGDASASFVTPRNVVFHHDGRTIVDYFGQAVSVLEPALGNLSVQGRSSHLVHEAVYLFLLSRVGEHLDSRGLTRVHSLGLAGRAGAVLVLLPSGGGKSTLAVRALSEPGVKLLAEDTPLLDRAGVVHPFPVRVAINEADAETLPAGAVHRIQRMEFHPKLVLDRSAFADRIATKPVPLAHIVIARRSLGRDAALDPLPRRAAFGPLLREAVVGIGVYQGMEFVLQKGFREVPGKAGIAFGRMRRCGAGLRRARVWQLTLGRDRERNWESLAPLLR